VVIIAALPLEAARLASRSQLPNHEAHNAPAYPKFQHWHYTARLGL